MGELLIRVSDALYKSSDVFINGSKVKFNDNGRGSHEINLQVNGQTEIYIRRNHELLSSLWWLWGLLFFVISCFGIFDIPYTRTSPIDCKVSVIVNGSGFIQFTPWPHKDGRAAYIECNNCGVYEVVNFANFELIKKRRKMLSLIKFFIWLALIAAIVLIVLL